MCVSLQSYLNPYFLILQRFTSLGSEFLENLGRFWRSWVSKYFAIACMYIFLKVIRQIIGVILYDNYKFCCIKVSLKGFIDGLKGKMGKAIKIDKYY